MATRELNQSFWTCATRRFSWERASENSWLLERTLFFLESESHPEKFHVQTKACKIQPEREGKESRQTEAGLEKCHAVVPRAN